MGPRQDRIVEPCIIWSSKEAFGWVLRSSAKANRWFVRGDCNSPVILLFVLSERYQSKLDCVSKCQHQPKWEVAFRVLCSRRDRRRSPSHPIREAHPNCRRDMKERLTLHIVVRHICTLLPARVSDKLMLLQLEGVPGLVARSTVNTDSAR